METTNNLYSQLLNNTNHYDSKHVHIVTWHSININLAIVTLNVITQMSCQKTGDLEQKQVYGSLSSLQLRKQDSGGLFTSSSFFFNNASRSMCTWLAAQASVLGLLCMKLNSIWRGCTSTSDMMVLTDGQLSICADLPEHLWEHCNVITSCG